MVSPLWSYVTPGIPDDLFERLPGIPMTQRETRVLLICALRLERHSVIWDVGAGTGTVSVEAGLLCPEGQVIAIERDEDVASLIRQNCQRFGIANVTVVEGSAPECLTGLLPNPDRACVEGGRSPKLILKEVWRCLRSGGRIVATAASLESLYQLSEGFAELQVRNIEVVQAGINRLEGRGTHQVFAAGDPIFVLSGEKLD